MPTSTSSMDYKAIAKRLFLEMWNKGNLVFADQFYASDAVSYDMFIPDLEPGPEDAKQRVQTYRKAFPDLNITIENLLGEKNVVIIRWTANGTHRGELMGILATGKPIRIPGTTTYQFRRGKVVKEWVNWNPMEMLKQLGVLPQWMKGK